MIAGVDPVLVDQDRRIGCHEGGAHGRHQGGYDDSEHGTTPPPHRMTPVATNSTPGAILRRVSTIKRTCLGLTSWPLFMMLVVSAKNGISGSRSSPSPREYP